LPFYTQGFCQHGWQLERVDEPSYKHIGKKITYQDLPDDCQRAVRMDYVALWCLPEELIGRPELAQAINREG
jgi:hypothetical protein